MNLFSIWNQLNDANKQEFKKAILRQTKNNKDVINLFEFMEHSEKIPREIELDMIYDGLDMIVKKEIMNYGKETKINWNLLSNEQINKIKHYIENNFSKEDIKEIIDFLEILKTGKLQGKEIDILAIDNSNLLIDACNKLSIVPLEEDQSNKFKKNDIELNFLRFSQIAIAPNNPLAQNNYIVEIRTNEELVELLKFVKYNYKKIDENKDTSFVFRLYPEVATGNLPVYLMGKKYGLKGSNINICDYHNILDSVKKDITPMSLNDVKVLINMIDVLLENIPANASNLDKINFISEVLSSYFDKTISNEILQKRTSIINFILGQGVYADISDIVVLLCSYIGIPCIKLTANPRWNDIKHSFNKVKINDSTGYVCLDVMNLNYTLGIGVHLQPDSIYFKNIEYELDYINECLNSLNKSIKGVSKEDIKESFLRIHKWQIRIKNCRGNVKKGDDNFTRRFSRTKRINSSEFKELANGIPIQGDDSLSRLEETILGLFDNSRN